MVKIMHIINNLNVGGAESLLLNICDGLKKRNPVVDFVVVILEDKRALAAKFKEKGIRIICLDILSKNIGPFYKIKKILNVIKQEKPTIVHTHLLISDLFGQIAAFLAGIKYRVCTIHNMELKRDLGDWKSRKITSLLSTHLIAVSKCAKQFCVDKKLYPKRKMSVIYNAPSFEYDLKKPKCLPKKNSSIRLINVGRLFDQKGQIYLLEAMKQLEKHTQKISLEIYGTGPYLEKFNDFVMENNLQNTLLMGLSNNVKSVLEKSDIFVASSLWEGFHIAIVEAMSVGLPIILTNIPPHRELLENIPDYPLFVEPGNSRAISEAIKRLILSPELYNELSKKCYERSKDFSISKMVQNYNSFYKSLE